MYRARRPGAVLSLAFAAAIGLLVLIPELTRANPATFTLTIGDANNCDANFIRPCRIAAAITYQEPGEIPTDPWTLDIPLGFFFAPDDEVNDQSRVGEATVVASVDPAGDPPCFEFINTTFPLYEATTNAGSPIAPPLATVDGDTNGVPDGVDMWPADIPVAGYAARYYGGSQHVGVNFLITDDGNGTYHIERKLFLDLPDGDFCNTTSESHELYGLSDDGPATTLPGPQTEGDEITHSCVNPGGYSLPMTVQGETQDFGVACAVPTQGSLPPFAIPDPLPQQHMQAGMPDFGQHAANWCWGAAGANVMKRFGAAHLDEPGDPGPDTHYDNMDIGSSADASQTKGSRYKENPLQDEYRTLLRRIVQSAWRDFNGNLDGVRDTNNEGRYFWNAGAMDWDIMLAYAKFLESAQSPYRVHAIVDNTVPPNTVTGCSSLNGLTVLPPGITGAIRQITLDDYRRAISSGAGVVLVLKTDNSSHAVTGVGYDLTGPQDTITIADPWTPATNNCADNSHNNNPAAAGYDTLALSNTAPLKVMYNCGGTTPATEETVAVLIFIAPQTTVPGGTPTPTPTIPPTSTVPPTATPTPTPTPTPPPGDTQNPFYSVYPDGPSACDPADILAEPGTIGTPCGIGGPDVLIPCANLTFAASCSAVGGAGPPANDDVSALSFATEPPLSGTLFFSVDTDAGGCGGTSVASQAAAGHPDGDEFFAVPPGGGGACNGGNTLLFPAPLLGLTEGNASEPPNDDDDLDALSWPGQGQPYFALAPGSPTRATLGADPSDVLTTPVLGGGPVIAIENTALGLLPGDAIDALCLFGAAEAANAWFSLAPGSPSLGTGGFSAADVLGGGPALVTASGEMGLLTTDNLDAIKCTTEGTPVPTPTPTVTPTPTPTPSPVVFGDVDCSGGPPSAVDALKILRFVATLSVSQTEPCPDIGTPAIAVAGAPSAVAGDVNCSGSVTAVDALAVLRFVAGLPGLPVPSGCRDIGA